MLNENKKKLSKKITQIDPPKQKNENLIFIS